MNILALNVGSSSIKYCVFQNQKEILKGNLERVGEKSGKFKTRSSAIKHIKEIIDGKKIKIDSMGHRVVHGGDMKTIKITKSSLKQIEKYKEFAPLHQQAEIDVINACEKYFKLPQYAIFDTSFYVDMPTKAKIYALPYKYFKQGIKRYGFHGLSHSYISTKTKGKVISCHLGSGCSVTAINKGKPVDTSMGFTPLEGLIMGTRTGDFDPAIILHLIQKEKLTIQQINHILNKESGLKGISGISNDVRDLLASKNPRAKLAIESYIYRIAKYIGSYITAMNGVDCIVFTAGTGYRNAYIRNQVLNYLKFLNIDIDQKKNKNNELIISTRKSKVKLMVLETNEEQTITNEILKIKSKNNS
ncbi:MAG: acetate/propionate family kinase [Nanoarchaeota archaeon]|nr:acetate/propionate family kinase [Nanoarchaeota archaeon]